MLLDTIHSRQDLLDIPEEQLGTLCGEIRQFLVQNVSRTGGHLASNLGIVETTVAIHRVFDTSCDRLVFDVGHQCYVHKLLTGRRDRFGTLRQYGGLSGFPKPYEAEDDAFIAGYEPHIVGNSRHEEFWIPAEDLDKFNAHIVGKIAVTQEFG